MKKQVLKKEKHAAIYVRVSTEQQVDRDSLKSQRERLIKFCEKNKVTNYKVYEDAGISAKDTNRPALSKLLDEIKSGVVCAVYVTKIDRLTRSIMDQFELTKFFARMDVDLISSDQAIDMASPSGRLKYGLDGLLAQHEREVTSERVSIDMRHRASQGIWNGGVVPFGYTTQSLLTHQFKEAGLTEGEALIKACKICPYAKKLSVSEQEADIVRWIYKTYLETNSIRKTTTMLSDLGVKTRNGEWWASTSVHRILKSPVYIGVICYGKRAVHPSTGKLIKQDEEDWTVEDGEHAPIVSEELFGRVQDILQNSTMKPTKKGRPYLLTGVLKCGLCGGSMCGHTSHKKGNKKAYAYYQCVNRRQKGRAACTGINLPVQDFEEFVIHQLMHLSKDQTFLNDQEKMMAAFQRRYNEPNTISESKKLDVAIEDAQSRLNRLLDKLEKGLIDDEDYKPRYQTLKNDIANFKGKQNALADKALSKETTIQKRKMSFEEIASFSRGWNELDDRAKSLRIKSIVFEIHATKETVKMDVFMDLCNPSRMDRDSSPLPA